MQRLLFLVFGLLNGCAVRHGPVVPALAREPRPALGESRVLTFRRTAVMDTVTAILKGKTVSLCTKRPVPLTVRLVGATASYQAVAAPDGTFRFFHIAAGNYVLTATHPAYHPLAPSPIELGTGDVAEATLGMRCSPAKP